MNTCRGCGKAILWGETQTGAKIPLDNTVPIYRLEWQTNRMVAIREEKAFVSHFVTCPQRDRFKKKKPKQQVIDFEGRA